MRVLLYTTVFMRIQFKQLHTCRILFFFLNFYLIKNDSLRAHLSFFRNGLIPFTHLNTLIPGSRQVQPQSDLRPLSSSAGAARKQFVKEWNTKVKLFMRKFIVLSFLSVFFFFFNSLDIKPKPAFDLQKAATYCFALSLCLSLSAYTFIHPSHFQTVEEGTLTHWYLMDWLFSFVSHSQEPDDKQTRTQTRKWSWCSKHCRCTVTHSSHSLSLFSCICPHLHEYIYFFF